VYLVGVRDAVPYAGYVRQLVERRGLSSIVKLIAETDEPFAYYRAADVFVCTSFLETFSRAVLEAMAFGLPLISTDCCGVSEQVAWDFNALKFEFNDANALSVAMAKLLDSKLRREFAERSRAQFDTLPGYAEMLDSYEAVIRAAVLAVDAPQASARLTRQAA
jgi:O-antigen biosynthesis protein